MVRCFGNASITIQYRQSHHVAAVFVNIPMLQIGYKFRWRPTIEEIRKGFLLFLYVVYPQVS